MPVRYETREKIAIITLESADGRNRFDGEMHAQLQDAWRRFRDDPDRVVAIVTGGEARMFSAGSSGALEPGGEPKARGPARNLWETRFDWDLQGGLEVWKPIVCAVNGHCIDEGLTLALACDLRIASERAVFQYPEVQVGVPVINGAIRAPRLIGLAAAMELLLLGDFITARRAYEIGLVNRVVKHEELMPEALRVAERLARNAPLAMAAVKEVAVRAQAMSFDDALRMGEAFRKVVFATDDAREGARAVAEKRPPNYRGT